MVKSYTQEGITTGKRLCGKDLGALGHSKLHTSQQWTWHQGRFDNSLGSTSRSRASRGREVINPLCSAFFRSYSKYYVH